MTIKTAIRFVALSMALLFSGQVFAQVYVGDNTNTGTRSGGTSTGQMQCTYFTAASSGTPAVGNVYIGTAGVGAYMVVYSFTSSTSGALIEQSNLVSSTTAGWNSFTFATAMTITSGSQYYLCVFITTSGTLVGYGQTSTGTGNGLVYMNTTWPTAPATFTKSGLLVGNNLSGYLGTAAPATGPVLSNGHVLLSNGKPVIGDLTAAPVPMAWLIEGRNKRAAERKR